MLTEGASELGVNEEQVGAVLPIHWMTALKVSTLVMADCEATLHALEPSLLAEHTESHVTKAPDETTHDCGVDRQPLALQQHWPVR
jgi:hypothetical protein